MWTAPPSRSEVRAPVVCSLDLFAVAQVGDTGIDFPQSNSFESIHLAFAVDDALFERAKNRLEEAGIPTALIPGTK